MWIPTQWGQLVETCAGAYASLAIGVPRRTRGGLEGQVRAGEPDQLEGSPSLKGMVNHSNYKAQRVEGSSGPTRMGHKLTLGWSSGSWGPACWSGPWGRIPITWRLRTLGFLERSSGRKICLGEQFQTYHSLVFSKSLEGYSKAIEYIHSCTCQGSNWECRMLIPGPWLGPASRRIAFA